MGYTSNNLKVKKWSGSSNNAGAKQSLIKSAKILLNELKGEVVTNSSTYFTTVRYKKDAPYTEVDGIPFNSKRGNIFLPTRNENIKKQFIDSVKKYLTELNKTIQDADKYNKLVYVDIPKIQVNDSTYLEITIEPVFSVKQEESYTNKTYPTKVITIYNQLVGADYKNIENLKDSSQISYRNFNSTIRELLAGDSSLSEEDMKDITPSTVEELSDFISDLENGITVIPTNEEKQEKLAAALERRPSTSITVVNRPSDAIVSGSIGKSNLDKKSAPVSDTFDKRLDNFKSNTADKYSAYSGAIKLDRPGCIKLYEKDSSGGYKEPVTLNCFLTQSVQTSLREKFSIFQSLSGDVLAYFFGKQPIIYRFSAALYNTYNQQWWHDFRLAYDKTLRGTASVKKNVRTVISYEDHIIEGFFLEMNSNQSVVNPAIVNIDFSMLLLQETILGDYTENTAINNMDASYLLRTTTQVDSKSSANTINKPVTAESNKDMTAQNKKKILAVVPENLSIPNLGYITNLSDYFLRGNKEIIITDPSKIIWDVAEISIEAASEYFGLPTELMKKVKKAEVKTKAEIPPDSAVANQCKKAVNQAQKSTGIQILYGSDWENRPNKATDDNPDSDPNSNSETSTLRDMTLRDMTLKDWIKEKDTELALTENKYNGKEIIFGERLKNCYVTYATEMHRNDILDKTQKSMKNKFLLSRASAEHLKATRKIAELLGTGDKIPAGIEFGSSYKNMRAPNNYTIVYSWCKYTGDNQ